MKHLATLALLFVLAVCLSNGPSPVGAACCCPVFWTAYGDHCYRFFNKNDILWQDAENICRSFSMPSLGVGGSDYPSLGHLVSIHSPEELNFVRTFFGTSALEQGDDGMIWLGLHDMTTEGDFEWSDGTPVDFTSFAPDGPHTAGDEDCVEMNFDRTEWNDIPCGRSIGRVNNFICKLPMI